ncbi:MAG: hypothetical protein IKN83_01945 [Bacteroidaceae bacterium]|nr:hypothetical protein [Bacteroidaceae bacterium]
MQRAFVIVLPNLRRRLAEPSSSFRRTFDTIVGPHKRFSPDGAKDHEQG